jgi:hypothetical protein
VATVSAVDALSGLAGGWFAVTATSNEPETGLGSGGAAPDVVVRGGTVQVRSERSGSGTGRVYTISASARDLAGNRAFSTATCLVPHDNGKGAAGRD